LLADAENVLTYIDDVLVHSQTHEQHLKHLAAAIDKIGTANLRLKPRKCVFGSDLDWIRIFRTHADGGRSQTEAGQG
jgi:hypothetical protein